MQDDDENVHNHENQNHHYDTEKVGSARVSFSDPLSGPHNKKAGKKTATFIIPETSNDNGGTILSNDDIVEITLEFGNDSVAIHSVKTTDGEDIEDPELALLASGLDKRTSLIGNASTRFKQVSKEVKRLTSFTKRPLNKKFDRTKTAASHALKGLKFISKADAGTGWDAVEKRFYAITESSKELKKATEKLTESSEGLLPRSLFGKCIGMSEESKAFALELFDAVARRHHIHGEFIDIEQLRIFWEQISDQSFDSRLQTFFDMVDKDADGRITEAEVREIITLSASANKLSIIQKQAEEYAALILEELDPDNLGYIMIENLEMLLLQTPQNSARISDSKNLSKMLSQKLMRTQELNPIWRYHRDFKYFVMDNWKRVWVTVLWIIVMAGLFVYKYLQYKNKSTYEVMGVCVCIAKGAAETLKLNMALILLPVCRNTITWLRNKTKLGVVVPFDDNLNFHKIIAVAVAIGVGIHGISHLACDFPRLLNASPEKYEPMEPFFGDQPTSYWYFVKGVEGVTGIIMVVLMAIAFPLASPIFRRSKLKLPKLLANLTGFNAFWYSHHLFVIVYALLIVHGIKLYLTHEWYKKTTWMYIAIPITLYTGERLIRAFRSSVKPVKILKVAVYPGNVMALHMSKPHGFKYKSGQYMFVNCAAVSPFEWHPFSITSAPQDDYLSVHIRTLGDWTGQLKSIFSEVCQPPPSDSGMSGLLRADFLHGENNPNFPRLLIDGPYGAPAQDFKNYEVVLLVGLGIGATPMISIVKDIVNNMKAKEVEENALENGITGSPLPLNSKSRSSKGSKFKTQRAYFYWVTREQGSFDWFKGIMNEVAELDKKEVIEMHNYCTSVYEEGDARSALITMLQSLNLAKNGVDIVSGTRVKSHFAKPNWRNVYKRIAINHPKSKIGVFYCGSPQPTQELRQLALDFTHKTSTKFEFHKENF